MKGNGVAMKMDHKRGNHLHREGDVRWRGWAALLFLLLSIGGCASMDDAGRGENGKPPTPLYTISGSGGSTGGPLKLERVELNFSNDRGEITAPLKGRIKPYAVIRFDGNGLFRARWEVDGRAIEDIAITVSYGNTLTVRTGEGAIFPTFEPGLHTVTLRVEEPAPPFAVPVIRYFVTASENEGR